MIGKKSLRLFMQLIRFVVKGDAVSLVERHRVDRLHGIVEVVNIASSATPVQGRSPFCDDANEDEVR